MTLEPNQHTLIVEKLNCVEKNAHENKEYNVVERQINNVASGKDAGGK